MDGLENLDNQILQAIFSITSEELKLVIEAILHKYPDKYDKDYTEKLLKGIKRFFGQEIDAEKIFREYKSLISDCFFNRLSKKFKNELLNKGIELEKIDVLYETLGGYENYSEVNDVSNFSIVTKAPISTTNNHLYDENREFMAKEDFKQQELFIKIETNEKLNKQNDILEFKLDKKQLILLNEEFEKLQEKLDSLY